MRMLFAFVGVAGYLLSSVSAQGVCDFGRLQQCEGQFDDYLGFAPTSWHDPERKRQDLETQLQRAGIAGLGRVCRAFNLFKRCLGPDNYGPCLTVSAFVVSGIKARPAYEYIKIFTQFHFTCGAGYNTFLNNDCMAATWAAQQQTLTNCRHQFDSDADRDPRNACRYALDAMLCYETQFLATCGTPDPGWWACEYERIGTAIMYPQCGHRCSLPFAGGIGK